MNEPFEIMIASAGYFSKGDLLKVVHEHRSLINEKVFRILQVVNNFTLLVVPYREPTIHLQFNNLLCTILGGIL